MKSLFKITLLMIVLMSFASCNNSSAPNYQYFPNMYEPVGYEAYGEVEFLPSQMEAQLPADGSISRGHMPFEIDETFDGYNYAKANLVSPLSSAELEGTEGGQLYDIYCGICHGSKGDGQGTLVKREKILGVPAYNDIGRSLTQGSVYHTIYYGKNAMGSYANQLNEKERWQVVAYVMELKGELDDNAPAADAKEGATDAKEGAADAKEGEADAKDGAADAKEGDEDGATKENETKE